MQHNWPLVRKTFVLGFLMTATGVGLVVFIGWNEATILYVGLGSFFLFCSLVLAFFYVWMARVGASRLPKDWENHSPEAKHDFAEVRPGEKNKRFTLWLMQLNETQRRKAERPVAEKDE